MTGAAALGAAVLVFVTLLLPSAPQRLSAPAWRPGGAVVPGTFHVHTTRSDGTGSVDEVAGAAARAGLRFVIFTDHGDATRRPDAPTYRSGVLCLDAVEISTNGGHYAALGLAAAPYPLGGEAREVVEDVARLGGFGVATHPDSAKTELKWGGWDQAFDALEWLNADSEWRDERAPRLVATLLAYPFRPAATVAALFDRPATLERWDREAGRRRVFALAGADAHARGAWRAEGDPYQGRPLLRAPSYEASFGAFSLRVTLDRPLSGRADEDASALLTALRAGRVHTIVDAFARPGAFEFTARHGHAILREGDAVAPGEDAVILRARSNGPPGSRIVLFRDGHEVTRVTAGELVHATNRQGAYRAEAWLPGSGERPMPWAASNPIFVGARYLAPAGEPGATPFPVAGPVVATFETRAGWHVETPPGSAGEIQAGEKEVRLRCRLGRERAGQSPFAALGYEGPLPANASALGFRGSAAQPMRVSVQVRVPDRGPGERWARSIYLDARPREIVVPFAEMRPAGRTGSSLPRAGELRTILFVVDTAHAKPGSRWEFTLSDLRVLGPAPR